MDFEHALHIFNTLYQGINGYSLSTLGRAELGTKDKAFVYGEVSPEAFHSIIKHTHFKPNGTFYDLGSGTGKAVLLAYLLFPFSQVKGIELLRPLHNEAVQIEQRFKSEYEALQQSDKFIEFIHGDFLELDISDADVIFMHSTCFPDYIWEKLNPKLDNLKPGTCIITVTRTIESSNLHHLKSKEFGMAWGRATVHFYEKISCY